VPEIFDPATGRFTTVPTARLGAPYYPFMFVLPDGTVVDAGANEDPFATWKFDRRRHNGRLWMPSSETGIAPRCTSLEKS